LVAAFLGFLCGRVCALEVPLERVFVEDEDDFFLVDVLVAFSSFTTSAVAAGAVRELRLLLEDCLTSETVSVVAFLAFLLLFLEVEVTVAAGGVVTAATAFGVRLLLLAGVVVAGDAFEGVALHFCLI